MPIKDGLSNGTLYLVDTETGERSIFGGITEIDTASEAQNLVTEEEKDSSERFKWGDFALSIYTDYNFSARDAYLKCLKEGIDIFYVPNNFRRMHGYRVRRRSLRKRRAMKKLKLTWKKQKAQ